MQNPRWAPDNRTVTTTETGNMLKGVHYTQEAKKISPKNEKDLGMACHTPPLKKVKKQGEMPLPSLGPIPLKKCRIYIERPPLPLHVKLWQLEE